MAKGKNAAAAIVDAHYPGEMGGAAITRVLLGEVSPAGRLTTTVYPQSFVKRNSAGSYVRVQTRKTAAGVSKQRNVVQTGIKVSC